MPAPPKGTTGTEMRSLMARASASTERKERTTDQMRENASERRRIATRLNQRRYRERQKNHRSELERRVTLLHQRCRLLESFLDRRSRQQQRLPTDRYILRHLMVQLFNAYAFDERREIALPFLNLVCAPNVVHHSINGTLGERVYGIHNVYKWFEAEASIFTPIKTDPQSTVIKKLDGDGDVFTLERRVDLTIQYRTIVVMYPHMLAESAFLRKILGQCVQVRVSYTFLFNQQHQIASISTECAAIGGWYQQLQDLTLVSRVLELQNDIGSILMSEEKYPGCFMTTEREGDP